MEVVCRDRPSADGSSRPREGDRTGLGDRSIRSRRHDTIDGQPHSRVRHAGRAEQRCRSAAAWHQVRCAGAADGLPRRQMVRGGARRRLSRPPARQPRRAVRRRRGTSVNNALVGLSWAEAVAAAEPRDPLTAGERTDIITMFTELLDGLYVHLPLKRAMYGIDPVQQLRRLHERARLMSDDAFHREIAAILVNLRDAHTAYLAPSPLAGSAARLPFLVEQFGPDTSPRFIVSKVIRELVADRRFTEGVEIVAWNGVPIADAVRRRGESERGGRPDSAMARALDSLTFRPLGIGPPPDERWVIVGYRNGERAAVREHRFEWRFIDPGPAPDAAHPTAPA